MDFAIRYARVNAMSPDALRAWREAGRGSIAANFAVLQTMLEQARRFERGRALQMAAVHATIAASHASVAHCGLFASNALEALVCRLAQGALSPCPRVRNPWAPGARESVLHVVYLVRPVGGVTRMLVRWITHDAVRRHSLLLTEQSKHPVPEFVRQAVTESGGRICYLDGVPGAYFNMRNICGAWRAATISLSCIFARTISLPSSPLHRIQLRRPSFPSIMPTICSGWACRPVT